MTRILITGASRGIGRAVALRLAAPGRRILAHGRDGAALEVTCRGVNAKGGTARSIVADLADPAATRGAAMAAAEDGPLDALVHCAGVAVVKPLEQITLDDWSRSLAVGLTAPFLLTQALVPRLAAGSTIVHVLSVAARRGFSGWSAYCATKFGLDGFSQSLREELRGRGVRVVNIYPAATDTGLWAGVSGEWDRARMLRPEDVADAVAYALERPDRVTVESIEIGDVGGAL
jgi:NAD(P)-dependent dehydrogenase (short-subunit alcohol dehydrogenase family)